MDADWPFVQVIIREFEVSGGSPLAAAASIRRNFTIFREVLFATYCVVCD